MHVEPQTWHHGLVARWWAEFNHGGPEIAYFRRFVEAGQPALDVACGTGRLLVPYQLDGLDVDGCDVSADMLAHCRAAAERAGVTPNLYAQALHELALPRRYRTIFVCGGFGLGSSREQDVEALRRLHDHLEPGGTIVLDNEVPWANERLWPLWRAEGRAELPQSWRPPRERKVGSDGAEYALQIRIVSFDPLLQQVCWQIRATRWVDGELAEQDEHLLTATLYFVEELRVLLEGAGFVAVDVRGGYHDEPPTPDDGFVVYVARRPAA